MPAGDSPQPISEKKAALRESPKEPKNVVNQQPRTAPLPKEPKNAVGTVGIKRPQPNGLLSPTNPGTNGRLVYVRRRLETDQSKGGISASAEIVNSVSSKRPVVSAPQEQNLKHPNNVPQIQSASVFASPVVAAASPALPSGGSSAHPSFVKQSPGKVAVQPSMAVPASPAPQEQNLKHQSNVLQVQSASVFASPAVASASPALPSGGLSAHPSFVKQSPGKVAVHPCMAIPASLAAQEQNLKHQNDVLQSQSASVVASLAVAAASPALPSGGFSAHPSFVKQSPGKVAVQPSMAVPASPPPRNMVAVLQNSVAANLASRNAVATSTASRDAAATAATRCPVDLQRSSNQDWKERFIRLQAFLRHNEQSGQEEYIHFLRSLSSVGRSKHAIELENRAVNLLIEEAKELQKMNVLNVLGMIPPTDPLLLPTLPASAMHLPFPPRR